MKYKLYIRQYDITTNDYKVREEIVETNDIYHEIGKIYSTAFTEIKRIDYEKIDETKELKQEIEKLKIIEEKYKDSQLYIKDFKDEIERLNNIINNAKEYVYKMFNIEPANSREYDYHCGKLAEILDKGER